MKTSHTPGPWTYYGDTQVAYRGELIAEVLRGGNRQLPIQSNRALIAAAPELLRALMDIQEFLEAYPHHYATDISNRMEAAESAIAKATQP